MNELFPQISEQATKLARSYAEAALKMWASWQPYADELQKSFVLMARKALRAKSIDETNDILDGEGWFVPPSMSEANVASVHSILTSQQDVTAAIAAVIDYCDAGLAQRIVDTACAHKAFAGREALLKQALFAHVRGDYGLSIPVFLMQAEGAYLGFLEDLGIAESGIYKQNGWTASEVEALRDALPLGTMAAFAALKGFSSAMYEQFSANVRAAADLTTLRAKYPRGFLSRHAVLHGRDPQYDTRENSVKALFILDSVRDLIDTLLS